MASHRDGIKALRVACYRDYVDMLKLLLAYSTYEQVNTVTKSSVYDDTLLTACVWRRTQRHKEILKILLNAGANVNVTTHMYGHTALHIAASYCESEVVSILLEANADINSKDRSGLNSFWLAYRFHRLENMKLLLQYGIDLTPANNCIQLCSPLLGYPKQSYSCRNPTPLRIHFLKVKIFCTVCHIKELQTIVRWLRTQTILPEALDLSHELMWTPRSLKSSCRLVIRGTMRAKRPDDVRSLPLPHKLKEYLLFSDMIIQ